MKIYTSSIQYSPFFILLLFVSCSKMSDEGSKEITFFKEDLYSLKTKGRIVKLTEEGSKYTFTYGRDTLSYGMMHAPHIRTINFPMHNYNREQEGEGDNATFLYTQKEPTKTWLGFDVPNSKANQKLGYGEKTSLKLDIEVRIKASVDMRSKLVSEQFDLEITGAKALYHNE